MQAVEQLLSSAGLDINELVSRFGLNTDQAKSAIESLIPAVLGGFQKKADTGELDPVTNSGAAMDQPTAEAGNDILGRIFGSKETSCQVADHAAASTQGVSSSIRHNPLDAILGGKLISQLTDTQR